MAVPHDATEGSQLLRFESKIHGAIRSIPITEHTEALEIFALLRHLHGGELAAGLTKTVYVELRAGTTVFFLHRKFDVPFA